MPKFRRFRAAPALLHSRARGAVPAPPIAETDVPDDVVRLTSYAACAG